MERGWTTCCVPGISRSMTFADFPAIRRLRERRNMRYSCEERLLAIAKNVEAGCYLLIGERGLGKEEAGKALAEQLLGRSMECNPDFLSVCSEKGVVSVEQMGDVREFLSYKTMQSEMRVCMIFDADLMTVQAQNALLKTLEELPERTAIMLVAAEKLLSTIHSRAVEVRFEPLPEEVMRSLFPEKDDFLLYFSAGRIKVLEAYEDTEFLSTCRKLLPAISERNGEAILSTMHLLKEKDKECFFDAYGRDDMICFLGLVKRFIADSFAEGRLLRAYSADELLRIHDDFSEAEGRMRRKGQFTRNDFFDLMREFC